jgi:branched-chain amino acid transport system permease protein
MDQLLQHFLNALMLGGTYALLGIGLTLIFGIMRVVNFTHGELYAFGAYMMYLLVMLSGANFFAALLLAIVPRRGAGRRRSNTCCCDGCAAPTSTPPCWS